jgi:sulfur carrier protein ThiS
MRVRVVLYSTLREKLPPEARGRAELALEDGSSVKRVMEQLDLPSSVAWALNGNLERDVDLRLKDGDELQFFRVGAGGSGRIS